MRVNPSSVTGTGHCGRLPPVGLVRTTIQEDVATASFVQAATTETCLTSDLVQSEPSVRHGQRPNETVLFGTRRRLTVHSGLPPIGCPTDERRPGCCRSGTSTCPSSGVNLYGFFVTTIAEFSRVARVDPGQPPRAAGRNPRLPRRRLSRPGQAGQALSTTPEYSPRGPRSVRAMYLHRGSLGIPNAVPPGTLPPTRSTRTRPRRAHREHGSRGAGRFHAVVPLPSERVPASGCADTFVPGSGQPADHPAQRRGHDRAGGWLRALFNACRG